MIRIRLFLLTFPLAAALAGCGNDEFALPHYYEPTASTPLGRLITDYSDGYVGHVKQELQSELTRGVSLLSMGYVNERGYAMQLYLYKVSLGSVTLRVTFPDDLPVVGGLQPLSAQAAAIEDKSVHTVWGAVSAAGNQAAGILHTGGTVITADMGTAPAFFAVLDDGSALCLPAADYERWRPRILEGIGGQYHLLQDGYLLTTPDSANQARTAVGVTADGAEVLLIAVDGGDFYYSNGITYHDLALVLRAAGATDAMALVSGAPVTAVGREERSPRLFEVINKPSAGGIEAEIAHGIAIVER